ncbi:SusC/RagA family TonB-linked outer membrane protein [Albibacterium profundi]|uniref:TonB-dependent receptor n=1 Tax=Albibacterium profundi TaxID=3134906 RepID=A0ABV5CB90_9SPHI
MVNIYSKCKFLIIFSSLLILYAPEGRASGFTPDSRSVGLSSHTAKSALFADREVYGKVTDSAGMALPGVTVHVKNNNSIGTTTDLNGQYILQVPEGAVLVFSMVGFDAQEIAIENKTVIDVQLSFATSTLDETVVIGFGTQKKSDVVGAITTVKPSELRVPSSNLTTALAGRVAGIIGFQRSGEPGQDNADFFIRGVSTFGTGKKDPLILIDGVEFGVTELARLRPDDIESFSVLKDATATAVYGSRAANGVILIKTKEGKEGRPRIAFRAEGSVSSPTTSVELADPVTFMELYNEALLSRNSFAQPYYRNEKIDATREGKFPILYPAVDWREMLFKDYTLNHRYNLNVSGGGKVARYYVSGSLAQDNGVLRVNGINNFNNNIDLKSYTLRANVNVNLTKSTELVVRLNGNFDDYNGPIDGGQALYNRVIRSNPVDFVPYYPKDAEHAHVHHIMFGGTSDPDRPSRNPYADMVRGYKDYTRSLMFAQMELNQDFSFLTEGLTFRSMFNTNRVSRFDMLRSYNPFYYEIISHDNRTGEYSIYPINETTGTEFLSFQVDDDNRQQNTRFYFQSSLNYDRTFGEKHHVSGMVVSILQSALNARASSLQLSLPHRNFGISGRSTYAYDQKYYFDFNFGYNGSERFDAANRFGFFPSVGVAWTVSNEDFWKPLESVVNEFRIRGTYGYVGNDEIGSSRDRFFYLSEVNMNSGNRGSTFGERVNHSRNGINVTRYANNQITWETVKKLNLGLELGLFNEINIQADIYKDTRNNILMERADIPSTMGLTADVVANVGETEGGGVDVQFDWDRQMGSQMWLQVHGNFTYAHSEFKVYEEPIYEKEWWKSKIGYSIAQPWGFIAERLFVDDEDVSNSPPQDFGTPNIGGDIKYKDVNGDGKITDLDEVPIGYPTRPEIIYGFGFSFGWKSFDVSAFFQGSGYSSFWIDPSAVQPFVNGKQIMKAFADDHYSVENPDVYALWPRLSTENHANNVQRSTWWLRNGEFLRIKQAEIGYSLSQRAVEKLHLNKLRFYVNASNLFTFSHFKLWDIEMGGNGLGYPVQRVFNVGVDLSF